MPPSPGTPLFPVSPERMNQQKLTASPSLPSDLADLAKGTSRHYRNLSTASDVQSKVAVFNNLTRESTSQRLATDAALKRAILGREEAESELHGARSQLTESRDRERRVGERLESLFEELAIAKERQAHERGVFEKEVRRARKEAFRASSALVKVQEELKTVRGDSKGLKEELRTEKTSRANAEQANFELEYKLAGMTEELNMLREKVKLMDEEKKSKALVQALDENKENNQPPMTQDEIDAFWEKTPKREEPATKQKSPSRKNRFSRKASPREDPEPKDPDRWRFPGRRSFMPTFDSDESEGDEDQDDIDALKSNLRHERRQREGAEQMVHFLKMECQFQRCSCRIAEAQGTRYIHDHEWDQEVKKMEEERRSRAEGQTSAVNNPATQEAEEVTHPTEEESASEAQPNPVLDPEPEPEPLISFSPTTGTFHTVSSPITKESQVEDLPLYSPQASSSKTSTQPAPEPLTSPPPSPKPPPALPESSPESPNELEQAPLLEASPAFSPPPIRIPTSFATPSSKSSRLLLATPHRAPHTTAAPTRVITNTITTTIPLAIAADDVFSPAEGATPITRAEALEQIRARRGRARSFAMNGAGPRRGLLGTPGKEERRDISAPAGKC